MTKVKIYAEIEGERYSDLLDIYLKLKKCNYLKVIKVRRYEHEWPEQKCYVK